MLGRSRKREADAKAMQPAMRAMDAPKRENPLPGTTVRWVPAVESGQELGEHEALEQLHVARRTHERAKEAARDCTRLLKDSGEALDAAKARVRRFAER